MYYTHGRKYVARNSGSRLNAAGFFYFVEMLKIFYTFIALYENKVSFHIIIYVPVGRYGNRAAIYY